MERASRLAREIDRREAGPFGLGRGGGVNEAEANLWPQEHERVARPGAGASWPRRRLTTLVGCLIVSTRSPSPTNTAMSAVAAPGRRCSG